MKPTILHLRWLALRGSSLHPQCCVLFVDLPGSAVSGSATQARPNLSTLSVHPPRLGTVLRSLAHLRPEAVAAHRSGHATGTTK